jgi:hypothetical protein
MAAARREHRKMSPTQIHNVYCSALFTDYKHHKGIDASVYVAYNDSFTLQSQSAEPATMTDIPNLFTYITLIDSQSSCPLAFGACSNKEDILTQSQMWKASDAPEFLVTQEQELDGLLNQEVMGIRPIESLPPSSRLLSYKKVFPMAIY